MQLHDVAGSHDCDTVVGLAASYFDVPMVLVSLIERHEQLHLAKYGIAADTSPPGDALCDFLLAADRLQVVEDTQADERTRSSIYVTDRPFVRFYAGFPIRSNDGYIVGVFCIMDTKIRVLNDVQKAQFQQFGEIAQSIVCAHACAVALKHARSDLQESTQQLARATSAIAQAGRIAGIGRWEIDIRTMQVTWSDEVYRLHDLDMIEAKSIVGAIGYYAVPDQARVDAAVRDAIVNGTPFDFMAHLITAKGRVRRVRSVGERDESGASGARIIGIIQEIAEDEPSGVPMDPAQVHADRPEWIG